MRLIIDIQALQNDSKDRGIGRHSRDFIAALARRSHQHEVILVYSTALHGLSEAACRELKSGSDNVTLLHFDSLSNISVDEAQNADRAILAQLIYEKMLADLAPDVVLVASTVEGFADDTVIHGGHFPREYVLGSTFYDLIPLSDPDLYLPGVRVKSWFDDRLSALRRTDFLLAISRTSRDEAVDVLGFPKDHAHLAGSAANTQVFTLGGAPRSELVLERFGINRSYVMHAGAFEPRKNFEGLVREFGKLQSSIRDAVQLVVVCNPPDGGRRHLQNIAKELGLHSDQLIVTGFVSDAELVALYAGATVFAFPSLREGFGLPPLEAMTCGTATIASDNSSLPEVIGRADALFDPLLPGDLARVLGRVLTDHDFRRSLQEHARAQARLFDWTAIAQRSIAAMEWEASLQRNALTRSPPSMDMVLERVADIYANGRIARAEIVASVAALAENERTAMLYMAHARHGGEQFWRIEGPFDSSYSLAQVNRGMARSLDRLGHRVALESTDGSGDFAPDTDFLEANPDLGRMARRVNQSGHDEPDINSRNLFPPRIIGMRGKILTLHCYAWEETAFPHASVLAFNAQLDAIFVTSRHVKKLLIDNGVSVPIQVCGVGVDFLDTVQPDANYRIDAKPFRFLHISTGLARKGIDVLLDAFGDAFSASDAVSLVIKTSENDGNCVASALADHQRQRADFPDVVVVWDDLTSSELKALYLQCHVGVYPSRAEGFGLPIAEAIICGLPVITTAWGGQTDFCSAAYNWQVDFDFDLARTGLGLGGSLWAQPDRKMLTNCLIEAFTCDDDARKVMAGKAKAQVVRDQSWHVVASRHIWHARAKIAGSTGDNTPRIGWLSTWNEPCGIATYSRHILEHFSLPVKILARAGAQAWEQTISYNHSVNYCWEKPSNGGDLSAFADQVTRRHFDVIVIQFSFAFFNIAELTSVVERATRNGLAIVIELHATSLPAEGGGTDVLREMKRLLSRCTRILVHSVADLNRLKGVGLIDNVTLLPHGVVAAIPQVIRRSNDDSIPLIASFGFALPHKGLVELVEAIALLRDLNIPVRLKLMTAEFPDPASRRTKERVQKRIIELALSDLVECDFTFHSEATITQTLATADLIVFPYQYTDESASGAVRHGLVSGRPVAVTPLPIFSDLDGLVHKFQGTEPSAIAIGIRDILRDFADGSVETVRMQQSVAAFIAQFSFDRIGARLEGMCIALARDNRSLERTYPASSPHFRTAATRTTGQSIDGPPGSEIMRGPSIALAPARYQVTVTGHGETLGDDFPNLTLMLDGAQCAVDDQRIARVGSHLTWSGSVDITSQAMKLDIVAVVANPHSARLDQISIRPVK